MRRLQLFTATGLFLALSLAAPLAAADGASQAPAPLAQALSGEAKSDYEAAVLLYDDQDFGGASLKFQHAYAVSRDARLLWNAGACEKQLRHYAKTYLLVSQYLREAGKNLSADETNEATALLKTIESFVSHVTVQAEPAGIELSIDEAAVATLPTTEPIVSDMGSHRFLFHKPGYRDLVLNREVVGGAPTALVAKLEVEVKTGTLRVIAGTGDAIRVDGHLMGLGEWQGPLTGGVHTLTLSADQKKPYQTDVALVAGQTTTLRIGLEPLSKGEKTKFVAWPWVAGGLAVVAAVGIASYVAFAPDKATPPLAASGTIAPGYWALHY